MTKNDVFVGDVPRNISTPCSIFLRKGGSIYSTINGTCRYSQDLPQGGIEIPCLLYFSGDKKEVKKLLNLFKNSGRDKCRHKKGNNADEKTCKEKLDVVLTIEKINEDSSFSALKLSGGVKNESPAAAIMDCQCKSVGNSSKLLQNADHCETNLWVNFSKYCLTLEDKWIIENSIELTDRHINFSQTLIKQDFPSIQGLRLTLTQNTISGLPTNSIQVIHCKEDDTGSLLPI